MLIDKIIPKEDIKLINDAFSVKTEGQVLEKNSYDSEHERQSS